MNYVLFGLVVFVSIMVQAVTGSSFGIPMMTFNPFFLGDYNMCVTLASMLATTANLTIAIKMGKYSNFKVLAPVAAGNIVISWFALKFALSQPDATLIKMLGVFLILMSIYLFFFSKKLKMKPLWYLGVFAGALSGIMATLFGIGGPPVVLYFMAAAKDKNEYMGNMQVYFLITGLVNVAMRFIAGSVHMNVLPFYIEGVIVVIIGTWLGLKIFKKLNPSSLQKLIYLVMAIGGVSMLLT